MKEGATMMRTRRGPGLVGVLARTAVIPGQRRSSPVGWPDGRRAGANTNIEEGAVDCASRRYDRAEHSQEDRIATSAGARAGCTNKVSSPEEGVRNDESQDRRILGSGGSGQIIVTRVKRLSGGCARRGGV